MGNLKKLCRQTILIACLGVLTVSSSGCTLFGGLAAVYIDGLVFWKALPIIPVPAYWSQKVEDKYYEEERYDHVPILEPVEGEHAPLFCLDPPSKDEVIRALPDETSGGLPFVAETHRNNVRIVVEPIVDRVDDCKFYPMVGPARLHHCHYKCTVFYEKIKRSSWPVPFTHKDQTQDVVYIDHDHLIRCAGPQDYQ